MNMQALMAQAQKMQRDIVKSKEEVEKQTFQGKSEWITIEMNGAKKIISLKINFEGNLDEEDKEVLAEMFMIAYNDVLNKVDKETEKAMSKYGSALNGLF